MIKGSIVAIITPMKVSGAIDEEAFLRLIAWHLQEGAQGVVVLGSTGEGITILAEERARLIQLAISHVQGKVPVIVGTGSASTAQSIEFTKQAKELGADAALLVTPYYNKPTQQGLIEHFKAIAKAISFPQIVYNVPGRTCCDMLPMTVAKLAATCPEVIGVKEATGRVERVKELKALDCHIAQWSGDDLTALDFVLEGGDGVITVVGNVAPRAMATLCRQALAEHSESARNINEKLMDLHVKLFVESNPIPTKWLLAHLGMIQPGIRLPLTPLSERYHEAVKKAFLKSQEIKFET